MAETTPITAQNTPHGGELHVDAVAKQFGGLKVFDQISFRLQPGHILGVVGPNGAGKTTLINVISGLLPLTHGRVTLSGRDITHLPFHGRSRLGSNSQLPADQYISAVHGARKHLPEPCASATDRMPRRTDSML